MSAVLDAISTEGSWPFALLTAIVLIGGMLLERWIIRRGVPLYFRVGIPLRPRLVPLPTVPTGEGQTGSVGWKADGDEVRFWALPGERRAPMLLHGVVRLEKAQGRVGLDVWWAPPWSALLATFWLGNVAAIRGNALMVIAATGLFVMIGFFYFTAAQRVARELRFAWSRGEDEDG
jgi:hypothetical protein